MRWAPSCGLCGPGNRCEAWENGRHARAAQRGPRKIGQRYENVRRQSVSCCTAFQRRSVTRLQRQQARLNRKAGPTSSGTVSAPQLFASNTLTVTNTLDFLDELFLTKNWAGWSKLQVSNNSAAPDSGPELRQPERQGLPSGTAGRTSASLS